MGHLITDEWISSLCNDHFYQSNDLSKNELKTELNKRLTLWSTYWHVGHAHSGLWKMYIVTNGPWIPVMLLLNYNSVPDHSQCWQIPTIFICQQVNTHISNIWGEANVYEEKQRHWQSLPNMSFKALSRLFFVQIYLSFINI